MMKKRCAQAIRKAAAARAECIPRNWHRCSGDLIVQQLGEKVVRDGVL